MLRPIDVKLRGAILALLVRRFRRPIAAALGTFHQRLVAANQIAYAFAIAAAGQVGLLRLRLPSAGTRCRRNVQFATL
jgi:hypothetical protein